MEYITAIKKPFENPDLYLALSLLSFIPLMNIYVLGYLLDFCAGNELEGRKMVRRFVRGSEAFALVVIYSFLPAHCVYLFSLKAGIVAAFLLFPPFTKSIYRLSKGSMEDAIELKVLFESYRLSYLGELLKISLVTLLSFLIHLLIPVIGWVGILYGPSASFLYMLGRLPE